MKLLPKHTRPAYLVMLCLFTCALLMDLGSGMWHSPKTTAFIVVMTGLLFTNIKYWWATVLASIAFFGIYFFKFPRLANHSNLEFGASVLILLLVLLKLCGFKFKQAHHESISLLFRYTLITVYFIAGFHKLNSGFFQVDGSCVTAVNLLFNPMLFGDTFINQAWLIRTMQIAALVIEMTVPFGLLFCSTRKTAAWILVLFHFYLSLSNFSNFSAFGGFLIAGSVINFNSTLTKRFTRALKTYIVFTILSVITIYFITRFQLASPMLYRFYNGLLYNIGWLVLFSVLLTDEKVLDTIKNATVKTPLVYLPIVIFTLWGMQSYIGLSTTGNLSMFSNLITEKSRNNHYLINTQYTKVWNFEEDYITVIDITAEYGNRRNIINYDIPLIEFKNRMHHLVKYSKDKVSCTILHNGKKIHIPDIAKSEYSKPEWWHKFIQFRKIPRDGSNECMW